jgi:hypothetical protein
MLRVDPLFAAAEFRCRAPIVECFQDVLHVLQPRFWGLVVP